MRAIWKGAVAFGLVNVPVKLYAATGEHSVPLHQVHEADGGRIRYRKVCSVCGEEVQMADIAKGYQTDDGQMVILTDEDLDELPLPTEREIGVEEFVPADQVDPIMLGKTYYLEPEKTAAKPYALLREALKSTDRMAVVKVALRQRESMAVLRVRDDVICLQTLLWPDEVRAADFPILAADVQVRPQEAAMAASLVESLAADFDPSQFEDSYRQALEQVIEAKLSTGKTVVPKSAQDEAEEGGEVVDLLSALQRSVEKARNRRGGGAAAEASSSARTGTDDSAGAADAGESGGRSSGSTDSTDSADSADSAKKPAPKKRTTRKKADDDAPKASSGRSARSKKDDASAKDDAPAKKSTGRRRAS